LHSPKYRCRAGDKPGSRRLAIATNCLDTEEGRALVVGAVAATGAEGARFRSLCDIILGVVVSDDAHDHLAELMGVTYKSKFVDGWYQQGRAAGEAKGMAEGIAQGEAKRGATDILRILKSRGLSPTRAQRELIESCDDLAQLDTWFDRALTAATIAMVFEDLGQAAGTDRRDPRTKAQVPDHGFRSRAARSEPSM
jgi:hypothetical protein